ncbi:Flp family type IVb pilin [Roseibium salinum]|uniref:Flp family type IVb pilin n=1 Tax=Roseibium salinum TaxID=1604349 RepID=A0ABT3R7X7_9HYPH|nr:Flp family type IVb pilin [Roseibium sp. DSM 29163]MCX2725206.1 Flp family type IVb pilin [Roseibium sp. DSM 29163]MDN3720918.1 Flp family type IVb pilin [Roseibium salinum]
MNRTSAGREAIKHLGRRFLRDEEGATVIEYGLIAGLIGIVLLGLILSIGAAIRDDIFGAIVTALQKALAGG